MEKVVAQSLCMMGGKFYCFIVVLLGIFILYLRHIHYI